MLRLEGTGPLPLFITEDKADLFMTFFYILGDLAIVYQLGTLFIRLFLVEAKFIISTSTSVWLESRRERLLAVKEAAINYYRLISQS